MSDNDPNLESFRLAMRRLAASVSVLTAKVESGRQGITLTSTASVSFDPMSMVVCIGETAAIRPHLIEGLPVTINLLKSNQKDISDAFAWAKKGEEKFTVGSWESDDLGRQILKDAQAAMLGVIDKIVTYGSHYVVIIRIEETRIDQDVDPLVYADGSYCRIGESVV
ncbi:MAG: flavin reductase family protein [Magnetococcales bacterium]|nr:flavin reductase family protein [Magnetococcales bacterium]